MLINLPKLKGLIVLVNNTFGQFRSVFLITTVLGFIGGLLGGIGIGAIIPLFYFIVGEQSGQSDTISRTVETIFQKLHLPANPLILLLFIVLAFIIKAIVLFIADYYSQRASVKFEEDTRKEIFNRTLKSSWGYLLQQKIGYVDRIIMEDVNRGAQILPEASNIIITLTSITMYLVVALNISATITLLTIIPGLGLFFFLKKIFYRARVLSDKMIGMEKTVSHFVNENIIGAKTIKVKACEDEAVKKSYGFFEDFARSRLKLVIYYLYASSLFEPLSLILIALLFLLSYHTPAFNIASFVAVIYLIQKIFSFSQTFQVRLQNINQMTPSLRSIIRFKQALINNKESDSGNQSFYFAKSLEFNKVSFAYTDNKETVSDINLAIHKGETIGLIGPSGSGKTTIADLLLRLFRPTGGKILVDGQNIEKIELTAWRKNIGYVSQDIFLANDSIRSNIQFYNNQLSDEDITRAAKLANIYEDIMKLPEKFETVVGERGIKFSGGQRQRIVLARTLVSRPPILILDEATSALDNESEQLIKSAIDNLRGEVTVIIIAHRLSTVMDADRLVVLSDGKIIETGKPDELINDQTSYLSKVLNVGTGNNGN